MTGKELIFYILLNDLMDEVVIQDGVFIGLMNEKEAAAKFGVGIATIRSWYELGWLHGYEIGDQLYFWKSTPNPMAGRDIDE